MTDKLSTQAISNSRQTLNLIRSQVKSGRIDKDFVLKQLDKFSDIMQQVADMRAEQKTAGSFEALYNVSRLIGTSLDLQTVLDQVMDAVIQLTGAERGLLMLRDDDGNLQVQVARNFDQMTLSSEDFQYSRTITGRVMDNHQAILTTNAAEDPRFEGQASIVSQSLRSIMSAPLWARGSVIGVAYVENRAVSGLFSSEDLATLEALAGQAAVAIDNAVLFNETDQELAWRVEALLQLRRIDLQLSETLDTEKTMRYTLEWACRLANATSGHIGMLETIEEETRVIAAAHYGEDEDTDSPIYLEVVYPQIQEIVEKGESMTFDAGQYGVFTMLGVPILRDRKVIGIVILKRKDADLFTEEQRDLVERVVFRAGVAIENARLYRVAQEADRAKSEFVGVVAHDLKAPMTSIAGYTDLILMDGENLEVKQEEYLKRVRGTVSRMEMLVSDLADISRIESGHFLMDEMQVSVASVVSAVKDSAMPEIKSRKHVLVEDLEPDLPDMWVDYYRLAQVLTNLVSNAYKYTPDNGTITLRGFQNKGRIIFQVIDTGIGLSPEAIKKIGTKFWRSEDAYTRSQPGTGLGFAITRSLVEQMGSTLQIESQPGEGSTFSFDVGIAQ